MKLTESHEKSEKNFTKVKSFSPRYFVYPWTDEFNQAVSAELNSGHYGNLNAEPQQVEYNGEKFPAMEISLLLGLTLTKREFAKDCKYLVTNDNGASFEEWMPKGD